MGVLINSSSLPIRFARSFPKQWQDTMKCTCAKRLEKSEALAVVMCYVATWNQENC
jgi:hypothetical protein